ncbi:hypothetical protein D3C76_1115550 [compost metagenome]
MVVQRQAQSLAVLADLFEHFGGALPGGFLGVRDDRPERHREARRAMLRGSGSAYPLDMPGHGRQRLAPEHVGIGVPGRDFDGGVRRAAEIDRDMRLPLRPHGRRRALEAVETPVEIHRIGGGPDRPQRAQVFIGACIALVMVEVVAVAPQVLVIATADHVQGQSAIAELVERRQLASSQRRSDDTGTVGQKNAQSLGRCRNERTDHRSLGGIAEVAHQHPVETGRLMGLGESPDERGVDRLPQRLVHFRTGRGRDHAENFYAHYCRPRRRGRR